METFIFIYMILLTKCDCYLIPVSDNVKYFVPISNIRGINESLIYVKDNSGTNDDLITSLVLGLYSNQPVILATGEGYRDITKGQCNRDPNIILVTDTASLDDLILNSLNTILTSYWSPLYIILTDKNEFLTCENGTFNEAFLGILDKYTNKIWQSFRTVRVVLSFPYTCPHRFMIFSGKRPSNKGLYERNLKVITAKNKVELYAAIMESSHLRQLTDSYPLRLSIFERFPTSITECSKIHHYKKMNFNYSYGFCGMDAMVMQDLIEHYKYNVSMLKDDECDKYGYLEQEIHGTTGSLGCVVRNELDISFNSRFQVQYTTEHFHFLHFVSQDSLCIIIKSPEVIPLWQYVYNMTNAKTWLSLLFVLIMLAVIKWLAAIILRKKYNHKFKLHIYLINTITSTLFGFSVAKSSEKFRVLKGTSLISSIILLAMFQGNVNYRFTTRSREKQIKTLKQLYESPTTLVTSPSILSLLLYNVNSNETQQMEFVHRIEIKTTDVGIEIALQPNKATLSRGHDVEIELLLNYTDETGAPTMYVIDECIQAYYLSFIASTEFLFIEESINFMMRMLEAGLPLKYYVWTRRTIKLSNAYPKMGSEPRPFGRTKMENLRVAFALLLVGYLISTCAFVVEKYKGKLR